MGKTTFDGRRISMEEDLHEGMVFKTSTNPSFDISIHHHQLGTYISRTIQRDGSGKKVTSMPC